MRVLTDCRERLAGFLPSRTTWTSKRLPALDESERSLWRVLSPETAVWTAQPAREPLGSFWRRAIIIGQAPRSQFDALHEALADGLSLDGPTAMLALEGRGFRGQRGRPWSTVEGNLFLTFGVPIGAPAGDLLSGLVMLPAVVAVDAIRECGPERPQATIKWVNDILVDGRKVAGVLTATVCRQGVVEAAVFGLGVNVARAPVVEPTPFVPAAGCLTETGIEVTLARFLRSVLGRFAERYRALLDEGTAALLQPYRDASCVVGRQVRVWNESVDSLATPGEWPAPLASGRVRSIAPDLSLTIEGYERPITRGRLALEEVCVAMGL